MTSSAFEIKRLIAIDSYRRGGTTELKCDGHTSLTGRNGNGKTSLLKLIPLFYGESPSSLVKAGGVNKSFIEHYLPRSTSYILFEYLRDGELRMAVLHASANAEKVHYRFVGHGYEKERFVIGEKEIVAGSDLLKHMSKRGEDCSEIISSRRDYRAIIQNAVSKREHRPLAARYSFTTSAGKTPHLEKIASGIFRRETTFFDIKQMIVSCVDDDTGKVPLRTSQNELDEWVRDLRAYRAVMAQELHLVVLEQATLEFNTAAAGLATVHAEFQHLDRQHTGTISSLDLMLSTLDDILKRHNADTQKQLGELNSEIGVIGGHIKVLVTQIEQLDNQNQDYVARKMTVLADEVSRIAEMETDIAKHNVRIEALLGESSRLDATYATLKNEKTAAFNALQSEQQSLKDPLQKQKNTDEDAARKRTEAELIRIEAEFEEKAKLINDQQEESNQRIGEIRVRIQHPQASAAHVEAESKAQEAHEKAVQVATVAANDLNTADNSLSTLRTQYEKARRDLAELKSRKQTHEDERTRLLSMANAEPDTLLYFLRESCPSWTENIARVVPEDLLLRKDLSPSLVEGDSLAMYGVSLDLSLIDEPRIADEKAIKDAINLVVHQLHKLEHNMRQANQDNDALEESIRRAEKQRQLVHVLSVQRKSEADAAKLALDDAIRQRKADQNAARQRAQIEESTLASTLSELKAADEALKKAQKAKRKSLDEQLSAEINALRTALDAALNAIDGKIEAQKVLLDRALLELDDELNKALKAKGVDIDAVNGVKKAQSDLNKRLTAAQQARESVEAWKHWTAHEWPKREGYAKEHQTHVDTLQARNASLASLKEADRNFVSENQKQQRGVSEEKRKLEALRVHISRRLQILAVWPPNAEVAMRNDYPVRPQSILEVDMDRLLSEVGLARTAAKKAALLMTYPMKSHPGSEPYNFYEKRRLEQGAEDDERYAFNWHDILREWYGEAQAQVRTLLLDRCRTFSGGIQAFNKRLEGFSRKVTSFSTDLQTHMDSSVQFNNIRGVKARISTSFDNVEGWAVIKSMSDAYDVWAGADSMELPSVDFEMAVSQVSTALKGRHLEVDLANLLSLEIDIDEAAQPVKTVRDEKQLKDASSNGLSYLILCVVFVGLLNKIRGREPLTLLWALDELRDLDFGNVKALLELLQRNRINLVSAYPDADPDVLRLFTHRYSVKPGRKLAAAVLQEPAHV